MEQILHWKGAQKHQECAKNMVLVMKMSWLKWLTWFIETAITKSTMVARPWRSLRRKLEREENQAQKVAGILDH